jgi:outer membrane receptor protein involved in Fe transport
MLGAVLALLVISAAAQSPTGEIHGIVQDSSGLAAPGIPILVLDQETGRRYEAASNETGDYLVRSLPPGRYTISAEKEGFKKFVRQGVSVNALQNVRVDVVLEVGAVSQTVVVAGEAPQVDTRTSTVGTLVDDKRIVDLPLNGRNIVSLTALVPGVSRTSTANTVSSGQQSVAVNGGRSYTTNMQLDGGGLYYANRGQGLNMPPPDAVQEIKVVTSGVTAEYGRGSAVVSVVTKSGTNTMHGSAWDYLRNDALDSRSFFQRTIAKLRYNQFGATIGGSIIKNKLFYFGSYQGIRIRQDASSTSAFPPTTAERGGDFSASNPAPIDPENGLPFPNRVIPRSRFDPVAVKLLDKIMLPNDPSGRLSALTSSPKTGDMVTGKFDYTLRQNDRFTFRYHYDFQRGINSFPTVYGSGANIPGYSPAPNSDDINVATLSHLHTWTPNLITTTKGSFSLFVYDEFNSVRETLGELGAANFINGGGPDRLPQIVVEGRFIVSPGQDQQRYGSAYDFGQDWAWLRGRHELKWGVQVLRHGYRQTKNDVSAGWFAFDGTVSKNAMADFMLGRLVRFRQSSLFLLDGHYYIPAFYFQDTMKLTPRFTVNLGLRWEIYTPWRDARGQMAGYVAGAKSKSFPTAPLGMVYQTDPEYNYNTDFRNAAPRIGFAWDVFGNGKTSVRGGYAVSYDGFLSDQLLEGDQPFTLNVEIRNPGPLSNPYGTNRNPFPYTVDPANAVYTYPVIIGAPPVGKNLSAMYTQNVSLTVERQIFSDTMVQAAYVGNFARKVLNTFQFNPARYIPGRDERGNALSTTGNTDARRLLAPTYGGFRGFSSEANSNYNALQTLVNKRMSKGFTLLAHYTWSKAIDDVCTSEVASGCRQQNPFDRAGSRGLGDYDRRHVAVFSYLYELPGFRQSHAVVQHALGGWQIAGMNRIESGSSFSIQTGSDASLTGVGFDRPDVVGDWRLEGGRSKADEIARWFNTAAFRRNNPGEYGNSGRNIIIGPGSLTWDVSLQKTFAVAGENHKVEFRTDLFNLLNHANLNSPQASLASSQSFGKITGASSGRIVQFALRYEF